MGHDFWLLEPLHTFPVASAKAWLGRVVQDHTRPVAAYSPRTAPPNLSALAPSDPAPTGTNSRDEVSTSAAAQLPAIYPTLFDYHEDQGYSNVTHVANSLNSKHLRVLFLNHFGVSLKHFEEHENDFRSRVVHRWRIHHDKEALAAVVKLDIVKTDLEKWLHRPFQQAYFIVGLLITEEIMYKEKIDEHSDIKGQIDPVGLALAAHGVPNPPISPVHAGASGKQDAKTGMTAKGKRIFALEYRPFHYKIIPSKRGVTAMKGHGPKGDRSFAASQTLPASMVNHVEYVLSEQSFAEAVGEDEVDTDQEMYEPTSRDAGRASKGLDYDEHLMSDTMLFTIE